MNHDILREVLADQLELIREFTIVDRPYSFDEHLNYVLVGPRRAGKSVLLYKMVRDLVERGVSWEQIIFINFEDDRLSDFTAKDFDDLVLFHSELTDKKAYYFMDEIQIIPGWEKFARRMADHKEFLYITGSNASMLSGEIYSTLGGRFVPIEVLPYSFSEYLHARGADSIEKQLLSTKERGQLNRYFNEYCLDGGFPETLEIADKRSYLSGILQKVILGDIGVRKQIRNAGALRSLVKKLAETVQSDVSYTKICNSLKAIGLSVSKPSIIDYISYAEEAYLVFRLQNYYSKFAERESTAKYYFSDNGFLHLYLSEGNSAFLENLIAVHLHRIYGENIYFLKSSKTGIDVDFFVEETGEAIQAAEVLNADSIDREVDNLIRLSKKADYVRLFTILTRGQEETIEKDGVVIQVKAAEKYFLEV